MKYAFALLSMYAAVRSMRCGRTLYRAIREGRDIPAFALLAGVAWLWIGFTICPKSIRGRLRRAFIRFGEKARAHARLEDDENGE